jgi:DNA polymerase (family 10)
VTVVARSNDAVAEALQEFADLVAISGGDPYRVRAYEKAARSVAGYHLDVDGLDEKALMAIPSVGRRIADHPAAWASWRARSPAGAGAEAGPPGPAAASRWRWPSTSPNRSWPTW